MTTPIRILADAAEGELVDVLHAGDWMTCKVTWQRPRYHGTQVRVIEPDGREGESQTLNDMLPARQRQPEGR